MKVKGLLWSVCLVTMMSNPSWAGEPLSMEDVQKQIQALAAQVQQLSKTVEKQNEVIEQQAIALKEQEESSTQALAQIATSAGKTQSDSGVKISMKPMPKIESADGAYSFQPFGRVHLDMTAFDDDKKDHASNANFRRARLGFKGKLGHDFEYKTEVDFAEENVGLKEVSLTYKGIDGANITVGNTKPGFGMEQNTSANDILFLERSFATGAFTRDEELGAKVTTHGDHWTASLGVFNEDAGNDDTGDDEDITLDIRGSVNLLGLLDERSNHVLHLGGGYSHRNPTGNVRFSGKPAGDGDRVVDTGNFGSVDTVGVYGAELAGIFDQFSFQSEYFKADVERENGNPDVSLDGYYVQGGWVLTGESRSYKLSSGNFGAVKPSNPFDWKSGDWGAWEALVRYDHVDLTDRDAGIVGGKARNYTVGMNWYLNDYMRLMGNIVKVDTDDSAVVGDDDPTVYNLRAQWTF